MRVFPGAISDPHGSKLTIPWYFPIHKTAIGATESVPWEHVENVVDAVTALENNGYRILIAEQTDRSVPLNMISIAADDKIAIVVGNEVNGVSDSVIELYETSVEIPQFGTKHSFNVAVSTGILLWEISRKMRLG